MQQDYKLQQGHQVQVHQNHLEGFLKQTVRPHSQSFLFGTSGAQEFTFLMSFRVMLLLLLFRGHTVKMTK